MISDEELSEMGHADAELWWSHMGMLTVRKMAAELLQIRAEIERLKAWGRKTTSDEQLKGFSDLHQEHVMANAASLNGMADEIQKILKFRTGEERRKLPQKVLQASEVTEPGWYWWRKEEKSEWHPRKLDWYYSEAMNITVWIFWDELGNDWRVIYGEFIGPIPYPDADHADG